MCAAPASGSASALVQHADQRELCKYNPPHGFRALCRAPAANATLSMLRALRDPAVWIGTAGGFGYAPIAPGTFGSFAAVLLFLAAVWADLGFATYVVAVGVVSGVGIWASDRCEKAFGKKDDGRIVIDEVAGQLITLAPVFFVGPGLTRTGIAWVVTGFVLFRVLDIWKQGPCGGPSGGSREDSG